MSGEGTTPAGYERCARCDALVGLGNLPRDFHGQTVCDDCFTWLAQRDSLSNRLARRAGAWREKLRRLLSG